MSGLIAHMHHRSCSNCGHGLCHHDRVRVYPDDGPAGAYHYEYLDCPDGNGVFQQ